jgi:flap endonuclease-1
MGVNLREIANPREIELEELAGKAVAIDALNTIYQFLSIIRDRLTGEPLKDSGGRVTSHLSGLFYRTTRLLESGIVPVFVFDGKPPEFKRGVQLARHKVREQARKKWEQAVREGDAEKVRLYSQQASKVTDEMLDEAKRLLEAMGVQWIQGPSEGEAEAAYLNRRDLVYACGSQDWDSLLFGARRLVRNITITGKRKLPGKETYVTIRPHVIDLESMLKGLGISHEQLIMLGILTGTDYNPGGVPGYGPKKALELVRERKTLESVLSGVEWEFDTPAAVIFDFFRNPPAKAATVEKKQPDPQLVEKILIDDHDFSPDRIQRTLQKLEGAQDQRKQSSLQKFL